MILIKIALCDKKYKLFKVSKRDNRTPMHVTQASSR